MPPPRTLPRLDTSASLDPRPRLAAFGSFALIGVSLIACSPRGGGPPTTSAVFPQPVPVVRVAEGELVDGLGNPLLLRGIAFGNRVWQDDPLPDEHHGEIDFQRVADLGMNSVRFYLGYQTFEDDLKPGEYKPEGFAWLDQNVAWARAHDVYVVLNMHVPPGGYQSLGEGRALWSDVAAQKRFIDLWRAIAARYRGDPVIAGYDLLNEPAPPEDRAQWKDLAERTITAIRAVDPEHAIFVERVNAVGGDWREDRDRNLLLVGDPNVVYEFHFYKPLHFTHQGAPWIEFIAKEQRYPDPGQVGVEWFHLTREAGTETSPKLPVGDSNWTFYQGMPYRVEDPRLVVGNVVLVAGDNFGKAYFDDLIVEELDLEGRVAREILRVDLAKKAGWFFWTKDGSGARTEEPAGHDDDGSLAVAGTRSQATVAADVLRFPVRAGAVYRASGWMKGEQIPDGATCQIRLDFSSSAVPVHPLDRAYLAQELDAYVAFGEAHRVPLYLGEFGTIRESFEKDRGGERWVADMLDLLAERRVSFAYHDYHEEWFGLFFGEGMLPSPHNANDQLMAVLADRLARPAPEPSAAEAETADAAPEPVAPAPGAAERGANEAAPSAAAPAISSAAPAGSSMAPPVTPTR
ncbi:MAG: glycoside hydrolase family 5 protein [Polyangiaceae bacterium]|nr:glycoside hydrolase family 5 protein [Polyangiaceae bacterium]